MNTCLHILQPERGVRHVIMQRSISFSKLLYHHVRPRMKRTYRQPCMYRMQDTFSISIIWYMFINDAISIHDTSVTAPRPAKRLRKALRDDPNVTLLQIMQAIATSTAL